VPVSLPKLLPSPRVPEPSTAPSLNWGILAPGWIAHQFTASVHGLTRQRVVAVGSRSLERARQFAAETGGDTAYGSYAELVADPRVQAVYVAAPHSEHAALALLAIEAGKNVLVEKPFARNASEARKVVKAARAKGVTLMEAMWTRFLPRTDIVRQLLEDGILGELQTVIGDHGQPLLEVPRMLSPELAGGALLDLGIYPVSYTHFVLGRPSVVVARGELTDTRVDRQMSVLMGDFADHPHAQALVSTNMGAKTPTTFTITGSDARIELDAEFYAPGRVRLVAPDGSSTSSPYDAVTSHLGLAYEAAHFASLVADGYTESPTLPLDDTITVMETLDEIRRQVGVRYPGE
jgi:predicted dehydrogenase